MPKILVTGGAGFIGSHLCDALLARGDEVVCIDNLNDYYPRDIKLSNIEQNLKNPKYSFIELDIADYDALSTLFEDHKFDRIIHLAARAGVRPSIKIPLEYVRSNVVGTTNILELAKKHGVKVAFTASDPFLVNLIRDEIWQLVEGPVDLFFCNEEEAKSLTGKDDVIDCAHAIHAHAENVALTLGPKGSILMHGGEAIPIEGVEVDSLDTTGAGDMYAGGLLYGINNGMTWKQAGHLASHAAARIVSQLGARMDHKFTTAELEAFRE